MDVVTATSDKYILSFSFTEEEVLQALNDTGLGNKKEGVKVGMTVLRLENISISITVADVIAYYSKGKYKAY